MALNPVRAALLGVTILGASYLANILATMVSQVDGALGQTITPPTEILIDRDPITVPPPNVPVVRRPVALPVNVSSPVPTTANRFSADNVPAPITTNSVVTPITTARTSSSSISAVSTATSGTTSSNGRLSGSRVTRSVAVNSVPPSVSPNDTPAISGKGLTSTSAAVTTVAASDPVNVPANVPVPSANPDQPTDLNQLFAFLSQNIPPVDGAANELNYMVILPSTAESLLAQVQEIVPTAKVISSRMGSCIQVQAYRERGRAEALTAMLRSVGFDARVLHQDGA